MTEKAAPGSVYTLEPGYRIRYFHADTCSMAEATVCMVRTPDEAEYTGGRRIQLSDFHPLEERELIEVFDPYQMNGERMVFFPQPHLYYVI